MSGYRRFAAYVYEYRNGKKDKNCGFIKVEVRDRKCTMEVHLHCQGLPAGENYKVYGFVRGDGLLNGILLGACETIADGVEYTLEADSWSLGDSGIPFTRISGVLLLTDSGGFFGTEWDDQPIKPMNFRELPGKTENYGLQEKEKILKEEVEVQAEAFENEENLKEAAKEAEEPETADEMEVTGEPETEAGSAACPDFDLDLKPSMPATSSEPSISGLGSHSMKNAFHPHRQFGEEFSPFEDTDLLLCWKIHPQDLPAVSRRLCPMRNNRFLQYGYYSFGHLLLCRRADGKYILGVPGAYDQQERFMAGMFGFPWFKETAYIRVPKGRGGYWYRVLEAVDEG